MSTTSQDQTPLDQIRVGDRDNFQEGPPLELFRRLRSECPVHWIERHRRVPRRGRVLVGHDRGRRLRGQPRLADLLLGDRRLRRAEATRSCRSSCSRRCSSGWTRPSTTASRRSSSAASRRSGSPSTRTRSARSPSRCSIGSRAATTCDLVNDVAQPVGRARHRQLHGPPAARTTRSGRADGERIVGAGDPDATPGARRA